MEFRPAAAWCWENGAEAGPAKVRGFAVYEAPYDDSPEGKRAWDAYYPRSARAAAGWGPGRVL